ncbi:hypothetical protein [Chloroflexus sp. Y-396-1]|nr:hypothetical protein [Chloroflexus sp. Y-396-1]
MQVTHLPETQCIPEHIVCASRNIGINEVIANPHEQDTYFALDDTKNRLA